MNILAIETSCDETSAAVLKGEKGTDDLEILSVITASSMKLHIKTGGIIPENAARKQVEFILPTITESLSKAFPGVDPHTSLKENIDAIAVTVGPGLIGSLLVGVETAKTLALVFDKPVIPVNHVKAHIYSAFLEKNKPQFPLIALIVSGGHTDFVYMENHNSYEIVGGTRDDAAGECFDKCARVLGLPYPGGPSIAKAAQSFIDQNPDVKLNLLPRPMIYEDNFDLSFSGLKTAVIRLNEKNKTKNTYSTERLAAEVQEAIVDSLVAKLSSVVESKEPKSLVVCGGVSANIRLGSVIFKGGHRSKLSPASIHIPQANFATDNAAMIGAFAFYNYDSLCENIFEIKADPELHF